MIRACNKGNVVAWFVSAVNLGRCYISENERLVEAYISLRSQPSACHADGLSLCYQRRKIGPYLTRSIEW